MTFDDDLYALDLLEKQILNKLIAKIVRLRTVKEMPKLNRCTVIGDAIEEMLDNRTVTNLLAIAVDRLADHEMPMKEAK
jgi:hypothetical protein